MQVLMTGCSSSMGATILKHLVGWGNQVFGVGVGGPDFEVDFAMPPHRMMDCANRIVLEALAEMGTIDVLINNAGVMHTAFMPDHHIEFFDRTMQVNAMMPLALIQACIKFHQKYAWKRLNKDHFRVINTGSMCVKQALRGTVGYTASKMALHAITRTAAKEAAGKYPLLAFMISPAAIADTNMIREGKKFLMDERGMTEEEADRYPYAGCPLNRAVTHDEIWKVVRMALEAPEYMSGCNFEMPGASGS